VGGAPGRAVRIHGQEVPADDPQLQEEPNPVPTDYLHTTENPDAHEAPASGWVQKLELRKEDDKDNLYAFVEWTAKAAAHIRAGEYRFCSGVFDFAATDLVTGKPIGCTLDSVALVNTPFIRGQKPIRLSQRHGAHGEDDMITKEMIRALNTVKKDSLVEALDQIEGDEVSSTQLEAAALFARAKDGEMDDEPEVAAAAALQDEEEEEEPEEEPTAASLADVPADVELAQPPGDEQDTARFADEGGEEAAALAPILEATGLDLAGFKAAATQNLDAIVAALTGALDQPAAPAPLAEAAALTLSTAQGKVKALNDRVTKQGAELEGFRKDEAERLVKALADEGKILIGDSDKWTKLCLTARPTFDALTPTLQQVVPMGEHASAVTPAPDAEEGEPIDETNEFVIRTRRSLDHAGHTDKKTQDKAIRKGLRTLAQRA